MHGLRRIDAVFGPEEIEGNIPRCEVRFVFFAGHGHGMGCTVERLRGVSGTAASQ